jgi:hypothetical protein
MSRGVTYQNGRLGLGIRRLLQLAVVGSAEGLIDELMVLARSSDGSANVKDALPARMGAAAFTGSRRTDGEGV